MGLRVNSYSPPIRETVSWYIHEPVLSGMSGTVSIWGLVAPDEASENSNRRWHLRASLGWRGHTVPQAMTCDEDGSVGASVSVVSGDGLWRCCRCWWRLLGIMLLYGPSIATQNSLLVES